jgi:hypothetical protein
VFIQVNVTGVSGGAEDGVRIEPGNENSTPNMGRNFVDVLLAIIVVQ